MARDEPGAEGAAGCITRWTRIGFEVRLEVTLADVTPVLVTMTRSEAIAHGLRDGDRVRVRPRIHDAVGAVL